VSTVPATEPLAGEAGDVRARILDAALHLMAEGGLHGTSMRALAADVGLNVATLYHYFPSKQVLFDEAVAHQHEALLVGEPPPPEASRRPEERLAALLEWLLVEIHERGEHIWRLLLGESLRGEPAVRAVAADLSRAFEATLAGWLADTLPELAGVEERTRLARTLRAAVYGGIVESLLSDEPWDARAARQAAELAASVRLRRDRP
jgi:AcrR family transcriptional regulator